MGEKREEEIEGDRTGDKSVSIEISSGTEAWRCRQESRKMAQEKTEKVFLCISSEWTWGPFCVCVRASTF